MAEENDYTEERQVFEWWFLNMAKGAAVLLKPDGQGAYQDEMVSAMFVGFCAGWTGKEVKASVEFKKSIMH